VACRSLENNALTGDFPQTLSSFYLGSQAVPPPSLPHPPPPPLSPPWVSASSEFIDNITFISLVAVGGAAVVTTVLASLGSKFARRPKSLPSDDVAESAWQEVDPALVAVVPVEVDEESAPFYTRTCTPP
jgi:hypothetical protein